MKKAISKAILRMAGWKLGPVDGVDLPKCIVCVAPHTSNWDFIVGKLFYTSIGCNAGFLIKKEWFFFPFNLLLIFLLIVMVAYCVRCVGRWVVQTFREEDYDWHSIVKL